MDLGLGFLEGVVLLGLISNQTWKSPLGSVGYPELVRHFAFIWQWRI